MPLRLTRPTNVPASREPLVDLLWRFYIKARRPPMRRIAEVIQAWDDEQRNGTANHETIRRTLRGEQVGAWQTVEVIFLALCELADVDPHDADDDDGDYYDRWNSPPAPTPHIERLHRCWNQAVDDSPMPDVPKSRKERAEEQAASRTREVAASPDDDPWGTAPPRTSGGFADEPPF